MQNEQTRQNSFFGIIYEDLIPADHLLRNLTARVDFGFVRELVSDCYCPDNGRPSWDPLVLFKVAFLQFLHDLLDRRPRHVAETTLNSNRMRVSKYFWIPAAPGSVTRTLLFPPPARSTTV